jgi:hypothetical protein
MQMCLPFNKSSLQGRELEFIFQTISNGQIAGAQTFSKKCHGLLEEVTGADFGGLLADSRPQWNKKATIPRGEVASS